MNGSRFGAHDDVLKASPSTAEEKERLVTEIKERAKLAFKNRDMPVCERLYSKAIEVRPESATMLANRAAVRLTMGQHEPSAADAEKATELDPSYAKGWYRLGQALEKLARFDEALRAFERGKALEPSSQVWVSAYEKCAKAKAEYVPPKKEEPVVERYEISSRLKAAVDEQQRAKSKKSEMRGYKLDSQGRKTTYFNHELDEDTKKLIGDIAPKKVEAEVKMDVTNGASSWNQAGTFEEKNHTAYARDWFQTKLRAIMVDLPPLDGPLRLPRYLTVAAVRDFKGDASVTLARGRKKHLLDISFTLEWEFPLDDKGLAKASGTASFPDVTADAIVANDPLDVLVTVDSNTPDAARHVVDAYVKSEHEGLRPALLQLGADFMADFSASK
mmetsp:Transcript_3076/g.9570  ORF Transcript_3076/g.9570 Transcript_3076/m.9570 type:complete len:388 (+) Transcript_3076:20-1183(+)